LATVWRKMHILWPKVREDASTTQAFILNEILIFILIFSTPGLESSTYSVC
jgi:hypothetical protein